MKFITSLAILSILPYLAQATTVRVTYDTTYDNPSWPLSNTACSNGVNGLENRWPTLGDVPKDPFLGGIPGLTWNSDLCGTCWQLEYELPGGNKNTIAITAVDAAGTFNIAKAAFHTLAGSSGVAAGAVDAIATQVAPSVCGI